MTGTLAHFAPEYALVESYNYWAKKRILFNTLVGIAGTLSLIPFIAYLRLFDLFGILVWGLVANGLFSIGYAIESYILVNSEGEKNLKTSRSILFWIGTLVYVLVSVLFVFYAFVVFPTLAAIER